MTPAPAPQGRVSQLPQGTVAAMAQRLSLARRRALAQPLLRARGPSRSVRQPGTGLWI
jgi:hypothetical protein